jgi:hypothetical protein
MLAAGIDYARGLWSSRAPLRHASPAAGAPDRQPPPWSRPRRAGPRTSGGRGRVRKAVEAVRAPRPHGPGHRGRGQLFSECRESSHAGSGAPVSRRATGREGSRFDAADAIHRPRRCPRWQHDGRGIAVAFANAGRQSRWSSSTRLRSTAMRGRGFTPPASRRQHGRGQSDAPRANQGRGQLRDFATRTS